MERVKNKESAPMKPFSVITIEAYTHSHDNRVIDYFEYVVLMDGELMYRIKTTPRKWHKSASPVRQFEKWLLDCKSDNGGKQII